MKDMTELERRISAALDRIATHVDSLERPAPEPAPEAAPDGGDLPPASELMADLEAERAVTAQLEERVRAIKDRQDTKVAALEQDLTSARNRIATLEEENRDLREAASADETDDTADLHAELDRLRAERAAEKAELAELLAELKPIAEESASA